MGVVAFGFFSLIYILGHLAHHFDIPLISPQTHPVILVAYILVAAMHVVSGLSLRACNQLLFSLRLLINLMLKDFDASEGRGTVLAKSVPMDACTILRWLALEPRYKTFICCPECSACYPDNSPNSYPELCSSSRPTLTPQTCGQHLRKSRNIHSRPTTSQSVVSSTTISWNGLERCFAVQELRI